MKSPNFYIFIYMKHIIKERLNAILENKVVTQEEIDSKLKNLMEIRKKATSERNALTKKIKELNKDIEYWKSMLPNQISLF